MFIFITPKGNRILREISRVDLVHLDRDPTGKVGGWGEDSPGVIKAWIYNFKEGGEKLIFAKRAVCPRCSPQQN